MTDPFIVYIPIYLRIRSLGVKVVALMNVGLLLYIMHNWLVSHRYYLAVCFWSASFRIPPSLRLFNTVVRRFAASIGLHRILMLLVINFHSYLGPAVLLVPAWLKH